MSEANEYPIGGDLTDDRVSGLLHSTLERLSRRTASNTSYITHVHEEGPETPFSSACGSGLCAYAGYDPSFASAQHIFSWTVNYDFASGHFHYLSTGAPTLNKFLAQYRYRRNTKTPEDQLTREADGSIVCQDSSMQIRDSAWAYFAGGIPQGTYLIGEVIFNLPSNFKGFAPEGIELDLRAKATGLTSTSTVQTFLGVYMPHCTDTVNLLTYTGEAHQQGTAPGEVIPTAGTADTYHLSTHRLTAQTLRDIWRPGDTVKLYVSCTSDHGSSFDSLELYIGALKVNYKK
tara:strand:- start:803 stop:1669 length:867 start_codon:yes stop_codon:yes gene_type:complete